MWQLVSVVCDIEIRESVKTCLVVLQCCAHIDAYIDFSEEEHIEDDLMNIGILK